MAFARQVLVIMAKDLRAELRTKEAINASLSFALVILLLFSFAFDPSEETTREISGGLLWIVFAFAGTLLLNRSFARELPNDCLDALIAAPIPGVRAVSGQGAGQLCSGDGGGVDRAAAVRNLLQCPLDVAVLAVDDGDGAGHVGDDGDRARSSARSRSTSGLREVMLPMLIFPILIPALLGAMQLTSGLIAGKPITADNDAWLKMLIGFDVMYTAVSVVLVETVLVGG